MWNPHCSDRIEAEVFWSNFGTQLGFVRPHYLRFVLRTEVGLRKPDGGAARDKLQTVSSIWGSYHEKAEQGSSTGKGKLWSKKIAIIDGGSTATHSKAISELEGWILLRELVLQEHIAVLKNWAAAHVVTKLKFWNPKQLLTFGDLSGFGLDGIRWPPARPPGKRPRKHLLEMAPPFLAAHLLTETQRPRSQSVNGTGAE